MLGTWRWNAGLGLLGAGLTILFSIGNNPLPTMLVRSLYAFLAFFALAYAARAVLALILRPPAMALHDGEQPEEKGASLDLSTPDDPEELNELLKSQLKGGAETGSAQETTEFRPLNPPQLVSTDNKKPEQMANAIRHLTGE